MSIRWDLGEDSPHIGIIGGSGSGKSELMAWIVAQFMRGGAGVVVLDPKATSHRWLMNRPGVLYCGERTMQFDVVMWLDDVLNYRVSKNLSAVRDIDWPRLVVVLEERNSLQDRLRDAWLDRRVPGQPQMSPAIKALDRLSSMGRSVGITVVLGAQETAVAAIGRRSNYGSFCVAGRTGESHWKNLGVIKPKTIRATPGSFGYVNNGTVTPFQAVFPNVLQHPDRLWEWATQGEQILDVHEMMSRGEEVGFPSPERNSSPDGTTPLPGMITLREFFGLHGIAYSQYSNWPSRYPDFPQPLDADARPRQYREVELMEWNEARLAGKEVVAA